MSYEERIERFCKVKNKNVRIKINLSFVETAGGKAVIQGGGSTCSNKNECDLKHCDLINKDEEVFALELINCYEVLKKK